MMGFLREKTNSYREDRMICGNYFGVVALEIK